MSTPIPEFIPEFSIYVACLASYNNGKLYGAWIDATQDADEIKADIANLLRSSPYPNTLITCPVCDGREHETCTVCDANGKVPSAEEFAIHDYQLGGINIGEYEDIDRVAAIAAALAEYDSDETRAAFVVWFNHAGPQYLKLDAFQGAYQGAFRTLEDWAED